MQMSATLTAACRDGGLDRFEEEEQGPAVGGGQAEGRGGGKESSHEIQVRVQRACSPLSLTIAADCRRLRSSRALT